VNERGIADRNKARAARQGWRVRGFATLLHKELLRFGKVALQTLLAPVLTALL